ncbi:Inorganic phosphate transporter PHO87 [Meyerozyma sp. JA9]|nr:Inorganic phosphate transporter PHO87 [Meyerozyma sp. JA9]
MKFSHSLKFNAIPEWQDYYLNYPTLKKTVYKLQQDQLSHREPNDGSTVVDGTTKTTISDLKHQLQNADAQGHSQEGSSSRGGGRGRYAGSARARRLLHRLGGRKEKLQKVNENNSSESDLERQIESFSTEKRDSDSAVVVEFEGDSTFDLAEAANSKVADPKRPEFDPLVVFAAQLSREVNKISDFYNAKEIEVFTDYDNLMKDLEHHKVNFNDVFRFTEAYHSDKANSDSHHQYHITSTLERTVSNGSVFDHINHIDNDIDAHRGLSDNEKHDYEDDEDDDDDDDDEDDAPSHNSALLNHADFNVRMQWKIALRKKSVAVFISLSELKSFIELNKIGFAKITKKFDKTCSYSIKEDFVNNYLPSHSHVFAPNTIATIDARLDQIIKVYAFLTGTATVEDARTDLKSHLREHIVWERNTVWKDMLSLEKRSYNLHVDGSNGAAKMGDEAAESSLLNLRLTTVNLPFGWSARGRRALSIPAFLLTWQMVKLAVIIAVFVILLTVKTFNDPVQHRCLAVLAASAMMWASEALPLYVTAMLVPLLVVTCKVLKNDDGSTMSGPDASAYILSTMWSSVIMILMGGFTLAAALSKYDIAKVISSYILAFAGTKPRNVLISIMSVSLFLAMWISNVAAPVLCYSLIQPVLRTLPTDSAFAQALVLGIALASNMAGMASPIASPQNVIAIESMNPSPGWGKWFAVALPVSIIGMVGIWLLLIFTFKISDARIKAYKPIKDPFTMKQYFISAVTITTIILWCVLSKIESTFGESGIISVIPIVLFFGTGLLKTDDLNNFPWSIILLAMGGIALGKGVSSSGLLYTIATALQKKVMNFNVFVILIIFGILILVVATFVSHTVAALIIIPLVKEVGEQLPQPHPLILVMGTALIASGAMGLPTSGFPNVTAISMTDEVGKPYLTVNTFITRGVPASIIAYICVITIGYGIMNALKF